MLDKLFIHKIIAIRYINPTANDMGEYLSSSSVAICSGSSTASGNYFIPCRIEYEGDILQYRESNLRDVNKTIIYIPPQYHLQQHDHIIVNIQSIGGNETGYKELGIVSGVNTAYKGFSTDIDHYEIIIENP